MKIGESDKGVETDSWTNNIDVIQRRTHHLSGRHTPSSGRTNSRRRWSKRERRRQSPHRGQCPHSGLRIGSYWGRIGPDSACFRRSPVLARAGMQFESHLGHSIPPHQRGFCFNVCTLTLLGSLGRWPRALPGAAVACEVMWVAGSGSWLVGSRTARF
jgi:hypothetical protein